MSSIEKRHTGWPKTWNCWELNLDYFTILEQQHLKQIDFQLIFWGTIQLASRVPANGLPVLEHRQEWNINTSACTWKSQFQSAFFVFSLNADDNSYWLHPWSFMSAKPLGVLKECPCPGFDFKLWWHCQRAVCTRPDATWEWGQRETRNCNTSDI